ncbi:PD-(D/E)XK nuclease family protein [Priestia megaterium]|uniref:PD-(D/E)XK nuclease family protein n=1 Tax=Priestia megaterium TaxID=1404 RepID=UPI001C2273BC|nr:PD-(D/E)XK nuclease family protein [Priestia megaterium]MBU8689504.1 PD-(D/E)XK nuclease family protein [Priestia megaterium]
MAEEISFDMELQLREWFDDNYEELRIIGGHALNTHVKEVAFQHIIQYWRKMKDIANEITETELTLTLPRQNTPLGREYTVRGNIDLLRTDDSFYMYDVKAESPDDIKGNMQKYKGQLNLYAKIFYDLYGDPMAKAAIIATGQTPLLRKAWASRDDEKINEELKKWNPFIEIPVDKDSTTEILNEFGVTVDKIEEHQFCPPPKEELQVKKRRNKTFAQHVCDNCDGRFSCPSFKDYILENGRANGNNTANIVKYYTKKIEDIPQIL